MPATAQPPDPSPAAPQVSVVIVNYNGASYIGACLDGIGGAFARHSYEVIVVDNASTDDSLALLRARTDIRLVASPTNDGFAGGNHRGVAVARGALLLLLNSDTVICDTLDALAERIADGAGAAGPRLLYADGSLQPSFGNEHAPWRIVLSWLVPSGLPWVGSLCSRVELRSDRYRERREDMAWISGACLMTRRDTWDRLGGLDLSYFMYCEDVDFCAGIRALGLPLVYEPACQLVHLEGGGRRWIGEAALGRTCRSYLHFVQKHYGRRQLLPFRIALGMVLLMRALALAVMTVLPRGRRDTVLVEKRRAFARWGLWLFEGRGR